jgi:polyisoprenoid-binding protein YceI
VRLSYNLVGGIILLVAANVVLAENRTFQTIPNDPKNSVQFVSDATLEKVVGKTTNIAGTFAFDLNDLSAKTVSAQFTVDLRTVDTGNSLRNYDMREKFLHTEKNPNAVFTLKSITNSDQMSLQSGETVRILAEGDLTINGVSKSYQIPVKLTYRKGDADTKQRLYGSSGDVLTVEAMWTVILGDHQIEQPQLFMMRVSPEQKLSLNFVMTDILPTKLPDPK